MCGRFSLTQAEIEKIAYRFQASILSTELKPHYNFAPSQETVAVVNWQNRKELMLMKWGLMPYWKRDSLLINVRKESLIEKPIFRSYLAQRCLIPADGFFEWRQEGSHKIPFRAVVNNLPLFAFAGIWEKSVQPNGSPLFSFAILTTEANSLITTVHDRMPVILREEDEKMWLNPALKTVQELSPLLQPYPAEKMSLYRVSPEVNSTRNDSPACIAPL